MPRVAKPKPVAPPRAKTSTKLAPLPPHGGARLPLGAHPKNTGGKKGRSGAKPREFKVWAQAQASDPDVQALAAAVLRDPTHPSYSNVLKQVLAYGVTPLPVVTETKHSGEVRQVLLFGGHKLTF